MPKKVVVKVRTKKSKKIIDTRAYCVGDLRSLQHSRLNEIGYATVGNAFSPCCSSAEAKQTIVKMKEIINNRIADAEHQVQYHKNALSSLQQIEKDLA